MGSIDAYSAQTKNQQLFFESPVLSEQEHILKVVMTGRKNAQATGASGFVDYVAVTKSVEKIYPTKISLQSTPTMWEVATKTTPKITYEPLNTNQKEIRYEVDPAMLEVKEDGTLYALQSGTTELIAIAKGKDGSEVRSLPLAITIIEGNVLGKVDYTSKYRTVLPEQYDMYMQNSDKATTLTMWKNDVQNASALLLTKDETVQATVKATNLVNEFGDVLPSTSIDVNFQKYVSTYTGSNWIPTNPRPFIPPAAPIGNRKDYPDVIYAPQMEVAEESVQPIWIQVKTTNETKSGTYHGKIQVELSDGIISELDITIEVLDITLDEQDDYYLNLWQYPYASASYYGVEAFSDEHLAIIRDQMLTYKAAGGKTGTASIVDEPWYHQTYYDYPSMVKWEYNQGEWQFDFTDFDKWVTFLLDDIGLSYVECYSIVPWGNIIRYTQDGIKQEQNAVPGTATWTNAWKPFLEALTKHVDEKNWHEHIIIAMDERSMSEMNAALNLIESIKNKEGNSFKVGGAVGSYNQSVWDRLFSVTPHIGNINTGNIPIEKIREISKQRRAEGKVTSIYTMIGDYPGMFTMSDPGEAAWTIWFAQSCDTDGFLRWAYDSFIPSQYEDNAYAYFESGDMFFVYPGDKEGANTKVRTSPRFEMMQEAIQDIKKLRQIKTSDASYETAVTSLFESVKNFNGQASSNGIGSAGFRTPSDKTRTALEDEVIRLHEQANQLAKQFDQGQLADYTNLNTTLDQIKGLDRNIYQANTLHVLDEIIKLVRFDYPLDHQQEVDVLDANLKQALNQLQLKLADYSKIDVLIELIQALDRNDYTNFEVVDKAIAAIEKDKDILHQQEVDAMLANLETAYHALQKKQQTNIMLDVLKETIRKAEAFDLSKYTVETANSVRKALLSAKMVFEDPKSQAQVDDANDFLLKAMEGLKQIENNKPNNNDQKQADIDTADTSNKQHYIWMILLTGLYITYKYRKQHA